MHAVVYKAALAAGDVRVLVTLAVPSDARTNFARAGVLDRAHAKYRVSKAIVTAIVDEHGTEHGTAATAFSSKKIVYTLGQPVCVDDWDPDIATVCTSGIHVFLTRRVAELYCLKGTNGAHHAWHDNGQKYVACAYKGGLLDGHFQSWHVNGQQSVECTYDEGDPVGRYHLWHDNGQKSVECTYRNGEREGHYHSWYDTGQTLMECTYKDGQFAGLCRR